MSSRSEKTRKAILDAGWALFAASGGREVKVADVAERAGVSRQAVYLHFGSRAGLLMALVEHIDESAGLVELIRGIQEAPTPREALYESQRVTARYCPTIHDVAMAMDRARSADPDVAAAYEDRMVKRRLGLREIVVALHAAGELDESWTVEEVIDAVWSSGTPRAFEELVGDRGWSLEQFERWLLHVARSFLKNP